MCSREPDNTNMHRPSCAQHYMWAHHSMHSCARKRHPRQTTSMDNQQDRELPCVRTVAGRSMAEYIKDYLVQHEAAHDLSICNADRSLSIHSSCHLLS
jgi:hypothetical protein